MEVDLLFWFLQNQEKRLLRGSRVARLTHPLYIFLSCFTKPRGTKKVRRLDSQNNATLVLLL
jgi:hypothetical protein